MGSNPTGTIGIGPVAQWIARKTSNLKVAGSSPARVAFADLTQWRWWAWVRSGLVPPTMGD